MKKIRSQYGQLGQSGASAADDLNKYSKALETKEATGAGSAGGFVPPLSGSQTEEDEIEKIEATEATGASSSGQYSGPSFFSEPNALVCLLSFEGYFLFDSNVKLFFDVSTLPFNLGNHSRSNSIRAAIKSAW